MIGRQKRKEEQTKISEEDRKKEDWKVSNGDESASTLLIVPFIVVLSVFFAFLMGGLIWVQWMQPEENEPNVKTETGAVTEVRYRNEEQTDAQIEDLELTATQDWMSRIFGNSSPVSITGKITIAGLSEQEKSRLNFIESDFVKDIGSFLNKEGIITSLIYFEEKTSCSSDQAQSYIASMSGITDQSLQIIFYPDYPGEYIFTLADKQKVVVQVQTQIMQTESMQNRPQPQQSYQISEQPQSPQPETDPPVSENIYDASGLNVYAVPEELQNYIGNQYLLQYALYDYLYQSGYYQVKSATVIGHSIDGDNRSASFQMVLDNGKSINAKYDLETRSYQFS